METVNTNNGDEYQNNKKLYTVYNLYRKLFLDTYTDFLYIIYRKLYLEKLDTLLY